MGIPFLCGAACGILSAWGIGGGTLLLMVMTLFLGVEQRTAQGINLLFFLPTAAAALWSHARQGNLDRKLLRFAIPWAFFGALAGAWTATALDPALFRRPFGAGLLICAVKMLAEGTPSAKDDKQS